MRGYGDPIGGMIRVQEKPVERMSENGCGSSGRRCHPVTTLPARHEDDEIAGETVPVSVPKLTRWAQLLIEHGDRASFRNSRDEWRRD